MFLIKKNFLDDQRYKEGKIILEVSLIKRSRGIDNIVMPVPSAFHQLTTPSPISRDTSVNSSVTLATQFSRNSSNSSFSSTTNSTTSNDDDNMRRINGMLGPRLGPRIRLHGFRR